MNILHFPFIAGVVAAFIALGLVGTLVEILIIRRLHGDLIMGLVATWGLALLIGAIVLIQLGPNEQPIPIPVEGHLAVGNAGFSTYSVLLSVVALAILGALHQVLQRTQWGAELRATIYDRDTAGSLGVRTGFINMSGFALGSGLGGVAGGLFAPLNALTPSMGDTYLPIAFIMVVVAGGSRIATSLLVTATLLGIAFTAGTILANSLMGLFAMLAIALILLRLAPTGLADRISDLQHSLKRGTKALQMWGQAK